jgi:S1-C subfamily serine protease
VVTSSFHTPDRTKVGIPTGDGNLDFRDAEVIGRDPGTDIALLRVTGGGLTPGKLREPKMEPGGPAPTGGDDGLAVGNLALALGRPGRTARASLRAIGVLGPSVDTPQGGTLDRYVESDRLVPRGFAGGPLVDVDGAVIGMNTRTLLRGCDIAVPVETLRRVVAELLQHGAIRKGYLGVGAYPTGQGALVASLEDGGPAATAGILVGDILVEVDGEKVSGPDSLRSVLADRANKAVKVSLIRGGQRQELDVTLGATP